jgi:hypothetical protein
MALRIHYDEDIRQGIVATLVALISGALCAGGDVRRLGPAVAALWAQAALYGLDWAGIVEEVRATLLMGRALLGEKSGGIVVSRVGK